MHPKLVKEAAKDRLFFNRERRLLSNGHWLVDLSAWGADLGWRQPADLSVDLGAELRIDGDGTVSQGQPVAQLFDAEADLTGRRLVPITPVRVEIGERRADTITDLGAVILAKKDRGRYRGISVTSVVLATEPDDQGNRIEIGLNPEYYAAIRLSEHRLYARGALDPVAIVSGDGDSARVVGLVYADADLTRYSIASLTDPYTRSTSGWA